MSTIQDLAPAHLARLARDLLQRDGGGRVTVARLIYRALELQSREPLALLCLSRFLDQDGTEQLSAAVLEYVLSDECSLSDEERQELDDLRFVAMWSWGFSRHRSGKSSLPEEAFEDRSRFRVEEEEYRSFVGQVLELSGSLAGACRAARTLVGTLGGCLTAERGDSATLLDVFAEGGFVETDAYREWLSASSEELEAVEESTP